MEINIKFSSEKFFHALKRTESNSKKTRYPQQGIIRLMREFFSTDIAHLLVV